MTSPVDLDSAESHPVNLLRARAEELAAEPKMEHESVLTLHLRHIRAEHYGDAATALSLYETANDVTFVALDNDTLSAVRKTYDEVYSGSAASSDEAIERLTRAVADLFGLDD